MRRAITPRPQLPHTLGTRHSLASLGRTATLFGGGYFRYSVPQFRYRRYDGSVTMYDGGGIAKPPKWPYPIWIGLTLRSQIVVLAHSMLISILTPSLLANSAIFSNTFSSLLSSSCGLGPMLCSLQGGMRSVIFG